MGQKAAIQSIPSYVQHAQNFWICAPAGVRLLLSQAAADYAAGAIDGTYLFAGGCE